MTVVGRLLIVAVAVLCGAVAQSARHHDDRCAQTVAQAKRLRPAGVAAQGAGIARDVLTRCDDSRDAVTVALLLQGNRDEADAARVARALVRREPGDYLGWYLLSGFERGAAAKAALARARALNPTVGLQAARP